MKNYILFLCSFFLSLALSAQDNNYKKAYIITNDDRQIDGWVDFRTDGMNSQQCDFKANKDDDIKSYKPFDIQKYKIPEENKYYISKQVMIDSIEYNYFLEYLVQGEMNLYYLMHNGQKYYFFEESNGHMTMVTKVPDKIVKYSRVQDFKYKGTLRYLFKDYPEIRKDIDDTKFFSQTEMIDIAKMYHDKTCKTGEQCIIYQNKKADNLYLKFNISAYTGIQFNTYFFDKTFPASIKSDNSVSPIIGARVYLSNARWSKSLSYGIDVSFAQVKNSEQWYNYGSNNDVVAYNFKYNSVLSTIRLGAKYTYMKRKLKPSVEFGLSNAFFFKSESTTNVKVQESGVNGFDDIIKMPSHFFGGYVSLGVDYPISNHFLFVNVVYEYMTSVIPPKKSDNNIQAPHIKVGFTF